MQFNELLYAAIGDMRQQDLSRAAGIDDGELSRYFAGKQQPAWPNIEKLMNALPKLRELIAQAH